MEKIELTLSVDAKTTRVRQYLSKLHLSNDVASRIKEVFIQELDSGMRGGLEASSLQMENTFVRETTTQGINGKFLALDLGGTNFRVMLLELTDGRITKEEVSYYTVKESKRLGPGAELFDFLAESIADFVAKHSLNGQRLPLGFTFSFPMIQSALNVGELVTWTKSFNCPGVVGTDAVEHLNSAIKRQGGSLAHDIEVVAILNDTTGTLVKGAYDDPATRIGLILGTGCNAAYIEKKENVMRWGSARPEDFTEVVIDPEMGAFGDNGCIDFVKTDFDRKVNAESLLPDSFTFEKYFAGKYIGDILRHALLGLHEEGLFCKGQKTDLLRPQGSVACADISAVEGEGGTDEASALLKRLGMGCAEDDLDILRFVCSLLSHRCALLVGITLAVLVERSKTQDASIAVTGSLYKLHPKLKDLLERYTRKYSGGWRSKTFLSDDGSGKGAGLVAAIAERIGKM